MRYTEDDYVKIHPDRTQKITTKSKIYFTVSGFSYPQGANLEGYPIIDKTQFTEEDEARSYAKKVQHGDHITYWVKINKRGLLYNPLGIYNLAIEKRVKRNSKDNWVFRKVSEDVFANYIEFLKTKNESYLRMAERSRVSS